MTIFASEKEKQWKTITYSIMAHIRLLPYGVSDFKQIRNEGMYTVDKTRYMKKMELTDHFNCDMVLYYLNRVMQTGESPKQMIDPNTKTEYGKMRKLIQLDKLDKYLRIAEIDTYL